MSMKTLASRIEYLGGNQNDRIKKQKLRSLQWALKNDYQTHMIKTPSKGVWPALININNLKPDYDKKYISVEHEAYLEPGDVFEDLEDNTHWMIYLPVLTETAYLRSEIIRCRYTLQIGDSSYWVYFQGPTETDLRWFIKRGINVNELNLSGTIYIKLNQETRDFFKRFTHIKVDGHIWEVQVTDSISVPGILELEVQEYYDNPIAELPEIIKRESDIIIGETTVKQDTVVGYYIPEEYQKSKFEWSVSGNDRVKLVQTMDDGRVGKVRIYPGAIGDYQVHYGDYSITCTIDWVKSYIKGETEVYPYDYYIYKGAGTYHLDTNLAKIISQDGQSCKIEILSGRMGQFTLYCTKEDGKEEHLDIKIKSLFGGKDESTIGIVS